MGFAHPSSPSLTRVFHVGDYIPLSPPEDPYLSANKDAIMYLLFTTDSSYILFSEVGAEVWLTRTYGWTNETLLYNARTGVVDCEVDGNSRCYASATKEGCQ